MAGSLRLQEHISAPSVPACLLINLARTLQGELDWQPFAPLVLNELLDVLITGSFLAYGELNQISTQPKSHLRSGGCTRSLTDVGGNVSGQGFFLYLPIESHSNGFSANSEISQV